MGLNLDQYIKRTSKDAFSRISDDVTKKLEDAATNAVSKALGKGLKAIGLSNKIVNDITSKFSDAVKAELGAEWYENADPVLNRLSGEGILNNRNPNKGNSISQKFSAEVNLDGISGSGIGESINDVPVLKYPENEGVYYCGFEFRDYQRPSPHRVATSSLKHHIFLPIPRNLVETHSLNYENTELGAAGAIADKLLRGDGAMKEAGVLGGSALINKLQSVSVLGEEGKAAAVGIQQAYGFAVNPHLSVLFKGGTLREHTFRWLLAPETPTESIALKQIINQFRIYSLPQFFGDTTAVFDYPKMCKVKFYPWADKNKNGESNVLDLYTIKQCMVKNIMVNYAPNGIPSFFAGTNEPTMIEFEIQLQEIEYLTSDDYGGGRSSKSFEKMMKAIEEAIKEPGEEAKAGNETTPPKTQEQIDSEVATATAGKTGVQREVAAGLTRANNGQAMKFGDFSGPKY